MNSSHLSIHQSLMMLCIEKQFLKNLKRRNRVSFSQPFCMGVGVCIRPLARARLGACAEALAVLPGRGRAHAPSCTGKVRGVRGGARSSAWAWACACAFFQGQAQGRARRRSQFCLGVGVCMRLLSWASSGACAEALAVLPGRGRVHASSCTGKLRGVRGGACSSACAGRACGSHPLARTPRGIATCFSCGVRCGEGMFSSKSGFLINVIEEMVLSIYGKKGSFCVFF
jgi:hypothetical protein